MTYDVVVVGLSFPVSAAKAKVVLERWNKEKDRRKKYMRKRRGGGGKAVVA